MAKSSVAKPLRVIWFIFLFIERAESSNNNQKYKKAFWIIADKSYFCTPKTRGVVAQLVEQRTENPCVGGSIPSHTTSKEKPFK